jgi:hypothetical protein
MWYLFQLTIIGFIIYIYSAKIPHPNETVGHVVAFGVLLAYCLTWVLTKTYDCLLFWTRKLANWRTAQRLKQQLQIRGRRR